MNIFVRIVEKYWKPMVAIFDRGGHEVECSEPLVLGELLDIEFANCKPTKLSQWLAELVHRMGERLCTVQIAYKQLDIVHLTPSELNRIITTQSTDPLELFVSLLPHDPPEEISFQIVVDRKTSGVVHLNMLFELDEIKERNLGLQIIEFLQATAKTVGARTWCCGLDPVTNAATQIYSQAGKGLLYHAMIRHEQKGYMSIPVNLEPLRFNADS